MQYLFSLFSILLLVACQSPQETSTDTESTPVEPVALSEAEALELDTATFAGGCFWCTEAVFERVRGVRSVVSGYTGGQEVDPTYQEVSAGQTSHAEGVQVYYEPSEISYEELVTIFFGTHDPTQLNRQGPDVGKQYRSAVYYHDPQQQQVVEGYVAELDKSEKYDKPIVTQVEPFDKFYIAEPYHQDYYRLNPNDPYIVQVAKPKVEKFRKNFADYAQEGLGL